MGSDGRHAPFKAGDKVVFGPTGQMMTVVKQILHHDCGETFWGNLVVIDEAGEKAVVNCWQCRLPDESARVNDE